MKDITKWLKELEKSNDDQKPIFSWEGDSLPPNPDSRPVLIFRWARSEEEVSLDPCVANDADVETS